jgi:hypothetical protein
MKPSAQRLACFAILMLLGLGFNFPLNGAQSGRSLFRHTGDSGDSHADEMFMRLIERPTTFRAAFAHLEKSSLDDNRVQLNPFPDLSFEVVQSQFGFSGAKHRAWFGNLANNQGSAVFIINGDRISGKINSTFGTFEIFPLADGDCIIVEHYTDKFPDCAVGHQAESASDPALEKGIAIPPNPTADTFDNASAGDAPMEGEPLADAPGTNHVRVIVAYTSGARYKTQTNYGRTMQEHIDLAIAEANQGYANSGVDTRIELACLYKTDFVETYDIQDDVDAFQNDGDGKADEVHQLRADYDADMCSLITDGRDIFWCGDSYGFDYTSRENMFQATNYSCVTSNLSFIHEFGHTQGCRHNDDTVLTPFAQGHGLRNDDNWRTIMALSNSTTAIRLNYWSNPEIVSPVEPFTAMGTPVNGDQFDTVINHETTPVDSTAPTNHVFEQDEFADKLVTGTLTVGAFTAEQGSTIRFRAGSGIVLHSGFQAVAGSEFRASLTDFSGDPSDL